MKPFLVVLPCSQWLYMLKESRHFFKLQLDFRQGLSNSEIILKKAFFLKYENLISRVLPHRIVKSSQKEEFLHLLFFQINNETSFYQCIERKYQGPENI